MEDDREEVKSAMVENVILSPQTTLWRVFILDV